MRGSHIKRVAIDIQVVGKQVRQRHRQRRVFRHREGIGVGDRIVVQRRDVERQRVRCRVGVHAAIGGAAIVLHLEAEGRVAIAVAICCRCKDQQSVRDIGRGNELAT